MHVIYHALTVKNVILATMFAATGHYALAVAGVALAVCWYALSTIQSATR